MKLDDVGGIVGEGGSGVSQLGNQGPAEVVARRLRPLNGGADADRTLGERGSFGGERNGRHGQRHYL